MARKETRYNLKLQDVPGHIEQFRKIRIPENMIPEIYERKKTDYYIIYEK